MNILIIVTSIFIFIVGAAKLLGAKPLADQFEEFGLPKAAMYVVGFLEVAAGIAIHVNLITFYVAVGLVILMIGAIANHMKVNHPLQASGPAFLVLVLSVVIMISFWGSAGELFSVLGIN